MANFLSIVFLLGCIILQQSQLAASIQCYECSGPLTTKSDCVKLKHIPPSDCEDGEICAAYVLKKPDVEVLYRSCAADNLCATLVEQYENNSAVTVGSCAVCITDECNSASIKVAILALSLMSFVMCLLL
ncbi:hypothetical protein Zmor_023350 [Zophobas morio]|uniref:Protein quiver n=1 Tax=Zophobas morio TaxID=2755281 RepID=A0AA38M6W5_9CUCU|nr:hypothetical protein Zmor_023350 [Zophobas morio]